MAEMPPPSSNAPAERWTKLIRGRLAMPKANAEVTIAMNSEVTVVGKSYESAIGSEKASMPIKCIDQMPQPIASEPPLSQSFDGTPSLRATRAERLSAVWDTKIATATDRNTSQAL